MGNQAELLQKSWSRMHTSVSRDGIPVKRQLFSKKWNIVDYIRLDIDAKHVKLL